MHDHFVLVLAGGRGERFWPWSRPQRPKQLLPLAPGGRTLLAATLERALALAPAAQVLVLTAHDLVNAVRDQCPAGVAVVGEPVGRNTAPAIGAAAAFFMARSSRAAFAVMPSDHLIEDLEGFRTDLSRGFEVAQRDRVLVTFGIRPGHPETNFGYLRRGAPLADRLHRVAEFTEKPALERAREWVAGGEHFWNSGIFVWGAAAILDALEATRPDLASPLRTLGSATDVAAFERGLATVLPPLESISIDYAVLERAPNVVMLEPRFDWDDLGSWSAWARRQPRDGRGNVTFGDAVAVDSDGCIVVGEGGTAAALGLRDTVVVNAGGATLCCPIDRTNQVRRVGEALRARTGATS
ncbi:MAG: mannose-1-phosphate guanylyltransferase [Candidatus Eisenbacteria bacterium]|uniref:Mannose-1-phosphate guanylyltransferase n=1 Tax=Eiseniibacteriota bacterium TaxID=2212470 RepID=A0A849SPB3_UNCEI|nr:mannose-1-phosphate guanylyltransferase [Candidatus Eisenbacteria bacterium]